MHARSEIAPRGPLSGNKGVDIERGEEHCGPGECPGANLNRGDVEIPALHSTAARVIMMAATLTGSNSWKQQVQTCREKLATRMLVVRTTCGNKFKVGQLWPGRSKLAARCLSPRQPVSQPSPCHLPWRDRLADVLATCEARTSAEGAGLSFVSPHQQRPNGDGASTIMQPEMTGDVQCHLSPLRAAWGNSWT